jgi:arsenite transporter
VAQRLDAWPSVVSIPIAICLFFMMYPIMVKIDFGEVVKAGRHPKAGAAHADRELGHQTVHHASPSHGFFLGGLFQGPAARHGGGQGRHRGRALPLLHRRRHLLGIAPCTAMVLVWGYLARGNQGHTLSWWPSTR